MSEAVQQPSNIIAFPVEHTPEYRATERINGIRLHLGRMEAAELQELEQHCLARLEEARTDLMIVQDYLANRPGPEAA